VAEHTVLRLWLTAALHRLADRATALVFAMVFTSATLAAIDALAHHDHTAQLAQASSSIERR
jgi:hypothetical protein